MKREYDENKYAEYPCYNCQGGGCGVCKGQGRIRIRIYPQSIFKNKEDE